MRPGARGMARRIGRRLLAHFWLKSLGITAIMTLFFSAYFRLLRHPWAHVSTIPLTAVDRWIGFQPWALPLYLSLWVYVCAPAVLLDARRELLRYAAGIGGVCAAGLAIFALWPTRIPSMQADYAGHPAFALLRGIDASGNACPSLHVASAVFAALALERVLPGLGLGRRSRWLSWIWCALIVYSTMAVKQHVLIDVACGALLGAAGAAAARWKWGAPGYDSSLID